MKEEKVKKIKMNLPRKKSSHISIFSDFKVIFYHFARHKIFSRVKNEKYSGILNCNKDKKGEVVEKSKRKRRKNIRWRTEKKC